MIDRARRTVAVTSALCLLGVPTRAWSDPMAQANANALNALAAGAVNTVSAQAVVPNYTTTPPEVALAGQPNLGVQANAAIAACAGSTDPSCQGALSGAKVAAAPKPAVSPYDRSVAGVKDIAANPGSVLGDLSAYYAGCTTTLVGGGAPVVSEKICRQFVTAGSLSCSNVLSKVPTGVASTCVPGTWVDVGVANRGPGDTMTVKTYCDPSNDSGKQKFQVYASGAGGACVGPLTFDLPSSGVTNTIVLGQLSPLWDGACVASFYVTAVPSLGCRGGMCQYNFEFGAAIGGQSSPVPGSPWSVAANFAQTSGHVSVTSNWDDQCATIAKTPTCTLKSGPNCLAGPGTREVGGIQIWADCWEYRSTYDCGTGTVDECAPLVAAGCVNHSRVCKTPDPMAIGGCAVWEETYRCTEPAVPITKVSNCEAPCPLESRLISPAVYSEQSCHEFLERKENQPCTKTLQVKVNWICPAGALSGPTRHVVDPVSGRGAWTCQMPNYLWAWQCPPPMTGPTVDPVTGASVCTDPVTSSTSAPQWLPVMEEYCPPPLVGPSGGMCTNTQTGISVAAPVRQAYVAMTVGAIPNVTDTWDNGCSGYEARVPPGLLPPDGKELPVGASATGPGVVDACERVASVCNGPSPETRTINDLDVTRSCWGFSNQFSCIENKPTTDCAPRPGGPPNGYQALEGDCALVGKSCMEWNTFTPAPTCTTYKLTYNCKMANAVYESVPNCGGLAPADTDFARSIAYIEAGREAGRYLDKTTLRVFGGVTSECVKKYAGGILVTNCCKQGGSGSGSLTDLTAAANLSTTVYKAVFSNYTYNMLFASSAPNWVLSAFEVMAGGQMGFSSSLSALVAGQISLPAYMASLGPYFWAMLVVQLSGILDCDDNSLATAMRRGANLCHYQGEYCSRRLKIIRTCLEKKERYCCFNSRLARIINEQGRPQVGKDWSTCEGFTIAELQRLNFSAMDLTEFYKEIAPTIPNWSTAVPGVSAKIPNCYYGGGQC